MYHLKVMTPEEVIFEDRVVALIAPGYYGYLGVLTNHAPLITILKNGIVTITDHHHRKHFYKISKGFLEVDQNQVFVLVESIQTTSPIDMNKGI